MPTNILSITNLRKWLETKTPEETYSYMDNSNCLGAQYCRHYGIPYKANIPIARRHGNFREKLEHIAARCPRTFGAALERAIEVEKELAS